MYPSYVNDGARTSINRGIWLDGTYASWPDWIQVDFNGSKTISEIDVITQQDNYQNPVEPSLSQTFSLYGITAFDVQYWNGSSWVTVPGGSVTGNNKVWRRFTFAPVTTSKIRVVVNTGQDNTYSRVVEVEAWNTSAVPSSINLNWLVADQLGTPRMVFDKTGSLATTKRHDYLPFGEELFASMGGRTTALGYTGDIIRQKFTSKERDNETGLDYFLARYYSSTQGRFTSPDEFTGGPDEYYDFKDLAAENPTFYADLTDPQSLNKYQYAYNNPLLYIDPDGHQAVREWFRKAASTAADFAEGVGRGISSSLTFGASGAPRSDDSLTNRAGQGVGTVATAAAGYAMFNAGGGVTILSGGSAAEVSVPVAVGGVVTLAGATVNAVRIAATPMQRNSTSQGSSEEPQPVSKKEAVKEAQQEVGKQPKGEPGKFGSPTRGTSRKGYRLDPPNPKGKGLEKTHRHINWWDYSKGKRSSGKGRKGYIPIKD